MYIFFLVCLFAAKYHLNRKHFKQKKAFFFFFFKKKKNLKTHFLYNKKKSSKKSSCTARLPQVGGFEAAEDGRLPGRSEAAGEAGERRARGWQRVMFLFKVFIGL